MFKTLLCCSALALLGNLTPSQAQFLTIVPKFEATDLLPTSEIILVGAREYTATRWSESGGFIEYPGWTRINAVNPSGLGYAGVIQPPNTQPEAWRWGVIPGWTQLPGPPAPATSYPLAQSLGISDDGLWVAGYASVTGGWPSRGYRWSHTGTVEYVESPSVASSLVRCISGNGEVLGGQLTEFGDSTWTAAFWDADLTRHAIVTSSEFAGVMALSHDGSVVAGQVELNAFRWTSGGGLELLPRPNNDTLPDASMRPVAMSADGEVIVGNLDGDQGAWIWTRDQGTRLIRDLAEQIFVDNEDSLSPFRAVTACSPDGLRIVGTQAGPTSVPVEGGGTFAFDDTWVLDLPADGVGLYSDLGEQLQGDFAPELSGFGALGPLTVAVLVFEAMPPNSSLGLVVGFSALGAPFKGGTMVPDVDLLRFLPTGDGTSGLGFLWPLGVPSGFSFYVQAWVPDAGAPVGYAASNGLRGTTP